jgi:hypothetical protein
MMYFSPDWRGPLMPGIGLITGAYHRSIVSVFRYVEQGATWIVDNGAFVGAFEPERYFAFLIDKQAWRVTCRFVVVPDVIQDAAGTIAQFEQYAPRIRALGYPVAYVAQDGAECLPFPTCDAVFLGGSTAWKMGAGATECIQRAKATGKWVHAGRVNSQKRCLHFLLLGADSCDGTDFVYHPDEAVRMIPRWIDHQPLFLLGG